MLSVLPTGLLSAAFCAHALAVEPESRRPRASCGDEPAPGYSKDAYAAVSGGSGWASFEESLNWTFELRAGQKVACDVAANGDLLRVDLIYLNEGHPKNFGHRDGFGAQAVIRLPVSRGIKAELGAGPLATFNSKRVNGVTTDKKHLGVLATAALVFDLNDSGLSLRAAYNHVQQFGAYSSDAILIGLGQEFGAVPGDRPSGSASWTADRTFWAAVMAGNSITNSGGASHSINYGIEIKGQWDHRWALSAVFIDQGDDGTRTNRKAIGAQVWQVVPLTENWTFTAGVGPLWGRNSRSTSDSELNGLVTFRAEWTFASNKSTKLFADFSRIFVTSDFGPDADLFRIGLSRKI